MRFTIENELLFCLDGEVAKLQLNKPTRGNALSIEMMQALIKALRCAQADPKVKIIILSARGWNFCTGADCSWANLESGLWNYGNHVLYELLNVLYYTHKPVLAQVQGTVIGSGVALVSLCDEVIAAENAKWSIYEVQLDIASSEFVPALMQVASFPALQKILMGATTWSSVQMQELGIVSKSVPEDHIYDAVNSAKKRWLSMPLQNMQLKKKFLHNIVKDRLEYGCHRAG